MTVMHGGITGRITASHREPDGTLVIDGIEVDAVTLLPSPPYGEAGNTIISISRR